jgi:hypothetical protein
VTLRDNIGRERLLRAFCAPKDWSIRYDLENPFCFDSLTYAADYQHTVRAELSNRIEEGTRRIPDMQRVWDRYWHPAGEFVPFELPAIDSPRLLKPDGKFLIGVCPLCDNRRISFGDKYPSEEEFESLSDWDVDDNTCRDQSCPLCHGKNFEGPSELMVRGVRMIYSRLKPLAALPNVRVAGNILQESTEGPLVFMADGFEGLAMGLLAQ